MAMHILVRSYRLYHCTMNMFLDITNYVMYKDTTNQLTVCI